MKFKSAELDVVAKIITLGVFILFLFIIISKPNIYVISILLLVLLLSGMFSPISYNIDEEFITVHFLFFRKKISRNDILEIKTLTSKELRYSIRTFGIGGLFGYTGFFYNSKFGNMTWLTTNRNYFVLISLNKGKNVVLSPKLRDEFMNFSTKNQENKF
jgi:hypothetical protein